MASVLWWSTVLIVLVLAAFVATVQIKKRLVSQDDPTGPGFTLADLRALHRSGKMSDQEFESAKQVLIGAAKRSADRPDDPKPAQPQPPASPS